MKKVAVVGINYASGIRMSRLIEKLRNSMKQYDLCFFICSSAGWELYQRILALDVDKIIVIDQLANEDDFSSESSSFNCITINDRIMIIGIDPIFFQKKPLSDEGRLRLQQSIFQIRRMILGEITPAGDFA